MGLELVSTALKETMQLDAIMCVIKCDRSARERAENELVWSQLQLNGSMSASDY